MSADQRPDRVKFITSGEISDAEPGGNGAGLVLARTPGGSEPAPPARSSFGLMAVIYTLACAIGGAAVAAWSVFEGPIP